MSKYSNTLYMHSDNSAANILRQVRPNSTVLEFGASNGYMTQYLKETLNCRTIVVELDEEDGNKAKQWADQAFLGPISGDIERYQWTDLENADHIIFADVLEHLHDPWRVLKEATKLLKPDGTILLSIPNVSHNSVIIDLLNGNFEYRELGLLDSTHIRFFTRKTLLSMIGDVGLKLTNEANTYCGVGGNEIKNAMYDVPPGVSSFLAQRQDGSLYQFVWECSKC